MKIGCAILAALALLSILACAGLFFGGKVWFEGTMEELDEMRPQLEADAKRIGANGPEACTKEGLRRVMMCGQFDIKCQSIAGAFGNFCLAETDTTQFCASVPPRTNFMEAANWAMAQCEQYGYSAEEQRCSNFFNNTIAAYCDR